MSKAKAKASQNHTQAAVLPCTCDPDRRLRRLPVEQIEPFQGALKALDATQQAKLARSMRELGFSFPEFVWHHPDGRWLCLDGHQRMAVLASEGWTVEGGVPVVEIEAADEQEAAKKLLVASSTYGKVQPQGLYEFTEAHGIDLVDFDLPDMPEIDMDAYHAAFGEDESSGDGAPRKPPNLGDRNKQIKAVLYSDSVELFERAIRATGEQNRGEAIKQVCEHYLADEASEDAAEG